jgi:predicted GNAT family N-acyltransferase/uncharacterized glyoxalase superfamily protein PhnB
VTAEVATAADWPEVAALRTRVFVEEQGVPPEIEQDDADATAVHAVSRDASGRVVATGRLLERDGVAVIGRMAADPAVRGQGHGAAVLAELHRQAVLRGHREVVLHAQLTARGFYERAGYAAVGDVYEEAGIAHVTMRRSLPAAPVISVMLAVEDAAAAAAWYRGALGAETLWDLGGVVGLSVQGGPFFLGQPERNGWTTPPMAGTRTVRVEVFVDDPDAFIRRAVAAGADGGVDPIRDHEAPWGVHRQGGFVDPFGHLWLVGDRSPLQVHPSSG